MNQKTTRFAFSLMVPTLLICSCREPGMAEPVPSPAPVQPPVATPPPMEDDAPEPPVTSGEGLVAANPENFYAWRNLMPPGPPVLHLKGTVQLSASNYSAALKPFAGTGFVLEITKAGDIGMTVIKDEEVHAHFPAGTGPTGKTVTVYLPDGKSFEVPVEEVH